MARRQKKCFVIASGGSKFAFFPRDKRSTRQSAESRRRELERETGRKYFVKNICR